LSLIYCGEEFADQIKAALPISELSEWGAFEKAFLNVIAITVDRWIRKRRSENGLDTVTIGSPETM